MKSFLALLVFLLPVLCEASTLRKEGQEEIANSQQDDENSKVKIVDFEKKLFKPFNKSEWKKYTEILFNLSAINSGSFFPDVLVCFMVSS